MNHMKAIQARREAALEWAGATYDEVVERAARNVTANIRIYAGSDNVQTEEDFVAFMRRRGGFSQFIQVVVGPEPYGKPNKIGMNENSDWWLWNILDEARGEIRERVQIALMRDFPAKQEKI